MSVKTTSAGVRNLYLGHRHEPSTKDSSMTTIQDDLAQLSKQAEDSLREQTRLKHLAEAFPDLKKHVGRWNKVAYYSKSVNGKVQRFDMRHNCGCCSDSPLEIWPYLETEHGKVFSDPPCFTVGERHWISGDTPYPGWKEKMREAGIHEDIIGTVGFHFKRCRQERIDAAEESEGDDDDDS